MKAKEGKKEPKFAAGSEGVLERSATKKEIKKGNYTIVTDLSFDEVDPS